MVLLPLNPSANIITKEVNLFDFKISHYDIDKDSDIIESPRIYLKSIKGLYEKLEFDTIYFSYQVQSHHSETFYDLILYKNGQFCAAKKSHPYKQYRRTGIKKQNFSCQGILPDSTMKHLQNLLSNSGINKYKDMRHSISLGTHVPHINTRIILGKQIKKYNCSVTDINILLLPFIKKLEQLIKFKEYKHKKVGHCFPTTFRKDLKTHCQ